MERSAPPAAAAGRASRAESAARARRQACEPLAKEARTGTAGPSRVGARGPNRIRERPGGWQHRLYKVVTSLVTGRPASRHFQKRGVIWGEFPPPFLSFVLIGGDEDGLGPGVLEDWPPG